MAGAEPDELGEFTKAKDDVAARRITTRKDLKEAFTRLGVSRGMSLMLHAAMTPLGYVVNGPHDVIEAVLDCIGPDGTMLVSANTSQLTDPAEWKAPPVPPEWVETIRRHMRPFDPRTTLIRGRGILPLTFLLYPDVHRSNHPVKSIAAKGKLAQHITSEHPLHESEGVGSPMHKLYLAKGYALLVGVDLVHCTPIHLAEFLADVPYLYKDNFKALVPNAAGQNEFVALKKYPVTSKYFYKLQEPLKAAGFLKESRFHDCPVFLLDVFNSVNFVVEILKRENYFLLSP